MYSFKEMISLHEPKQYDENAHDCLSYWGAYQILSVGKLMNTALALQVRIRKDKISLQISCNDV